MELCTFNVNYGYLEGVVRGYRSSFLTAMDYKKMGVAESLEDLRTVLESTDYASVFIDEQAQITTNIIAKLCKEKLANDYAYLRQQSDGKLALFLDFIAREKMIDNLIALLQGIVNKTKPEELLERIDPIGWFRGIKAIISSELGQSTEELYRIILCDTPIGPYFERYLTTVNYMGSGAGFADKRSPLDSTNIAIMKSTLKKLWLEDFYNFSISLGGTTAEVMSHILKTEADFRALSLTLNCINLNQTNTVIQDRNKLYTSIGYLYPYGTDKLCKAYNETTLQAALAPFPKYSHLYEACKSNLNGADTRLTRYDTGDKSLEDLIYAESVRLCEMSFEQQLHFGIFYAWVKLKEQEIRNIMWIADMILLKRPEQISRVLPIFKARV
ncbi:vacuolar ATP synthase subunit, putative [Theileria equi strain WA]|uniref:V-type proton ATPase subunit n=1 Tax=Theileria equi strain WA TaxID=1537102 RepID=L0B1W5_THEEQ|nr:vacuolar ATP synthase subunit, putative [Theileria equi strain WA]AFZ81468.1 vacuolar ATP synthase subunit, putative [Theileria equi strain WA]|eukprot:XP_004831134.1 vacuolar ATP synthase subunit, putative [Theileria equi strain WA]